MPLSLVGTTLAATTARQGPIQLASDGEAVVSRAVQADDTRLGTAATAGVSAGDLVFGTGEDGALADGPPAIAPQGPALPEHPVAGYKESEGIGPHGGPDRPSGLRASDGRGHLSVRGRPPRGDAQEGLPEDRKSTRLNSSHT